MITIVIFSFNTIRRNNNHNCSIGANRDAYSTLSFCMDAIYNTVMQWTYRLKTNNNLQQTTTWHLKMNK